MVDNSIFANALGTIGTLLWCVQLLPQIWHNYRKKDTSGLPASMILIWAVSCIPFGTYAIIQDFVLPLQVQPQIFGILSSVTWGQILYYDRNFSVLNTVILVISLCVLIGGGELLLVSSSELIYRAGITWHITMLAIAAAVLFVFGFFPAIIEIWSRRGRVAGISFGFLTIDVMGASFSLASLAFQKEFDLQGAILYLLVVIIEFGIAGSHLIWLWRTRHLHQKAKVLGVTFDELPEAVKYQRPGDKVIGEPEEAPIFIQNRDSGYGSVLCISTDSESPHSPTNT